MRPKETLLGNSDIFFKPVSGKRITGPKAWALNTALRFGALVMCPGDDIAMIAASSSNAIDPHTFSPAAILYESPKLTKPKFVYPKRRNMAPDISL
ncbi:MAG: hypothetical protein KBD51_00740 [Candidatus Levybacteria bacterium]|nr:hypothetical protein [Candidatus Levybacteria bacterium]